MGNKSIERTIPMKFDAVSMNFRGYRQELWLMGMLEAGGSFVTVDLQPGIQNRLLLSMMNILFLTRIIQVD
jgi:hypothetical protein